MDKQRSRQGFGQEACSIHHFGTDTFTSPLRNKNQCTRIVDAASIRKCWKAGYGQKLTSVKEKVDVQLDEREEKQKTKGMECGATCINVACLE